MHEVVGRAQRHAEQQVGQRLQRRGFSRLVGAVHDVQVGLARTGRRAEVDPVVGEMPEAGELQALDAHQSFRLPSLLIPIPGTRAGEVGEHARAALARERGEPLAARGLVGAEQVAHLGGQLSRQRRRVAVEPREQGLGVEHVGLDRARRPSSAPSVRATVRLARRSYRPARDLLHPHPVEPGGDLPQRAEQVVRVARQPPSQRRRSGQFHAGDQALGAARPARRDERALHRVRQRRPARVRCQRHRHALEACARHLARLDARAVRVDGDEADAALAVLADVPALRVAGHHDGGPGRMHLALVHVP